MKKAFIGSMHRDHRELFESAKRAHCDPGDECQIPELGPDGKDNPVNRLIGDWHHVLDAADVVIAVPKPDGTLGEGTVAELRHVLGIGKQVIIDAPPGTRVRHHQDSGDQDY